MMIRKIDGTSTPQEVLGVAVDKLVKEAGVTGLHLTIFNDGVPGLQQAFGLANAATGEALSSSHVFYGASLSKALFGYLVASLVVDGVIDLDVPLQQYFPVPIPELPYDKPWRGYRELATDPRYQMITARMCLNHTTGFQNWRFLTPSGPDLSQPLRIDFVPGSRYQYSGEGIRLLQLAVAAKTGRGLEALAQERVFVPLGMEMSSYSWQTRFEGHYCEGHSASQALVPRRKRRQAGAAGSLETTAADYAKFFGHVLRLAASGSPLTELLFTPSVRIRSQQQFGPEALVNSSDNDQIELSYGLGWGVLQTPYGPGAFKEGHDEGFQHYTIMFPETGVGVLLLANSDNAEGIFKEALAETIGDVYTPWYWEGYWPYG